MDKYTFKLFFKANLAFTSIIYLTFLFFNTDYTFVSFLLAMMGSLSTAATLYLIFAILLLPLTFFRKVLPIAGGLIFVIADLSLIVDFFVFRIYKFHINAMVLNIIFSPDALDSIQIGVAPVVLFLFFVLLLIFSEFFLYKKIQKIQPDIKKELNKKLNRYMIAPLFLIIVVEKISYGFMAVKNNKEVLSKFRVIPLYQPLTFNKFAYEHFGMRPDKVDVKNTIKTDAVLNYPRHELHIDKPNKFNVLIIASDATRYSVITPEVAPNLSRFKKQEDVVDFQDHISGGYATRFGIFSLMYGINSTYWFNFLDANKGSVLFDMLKHLGYEIHIVFSTYTSWPEFRKTCFVDIQESIKDDFKGQPWQRDMKSSTYLMKLLGKYDGKKPFFGFIFMDAPHGYSYPPNENLFHAESQNVNYIAVGKDTEENAAAWARYKNAVHFIDGRFAKIIDVLKQKGMYENTLIIFTSDHGEEFYEYGFFGHNSAFDEAQVHVPFIVKLPKKFANLKKKQQVKHITSHLDFVPTLFTMLGVKNKAADYSNGYNLFASDYNRSFAFCGGWNYNAIITPKYTYVFSNRPDDLFQNEVRDTKTYKLLKNVPVNTKMVFEAIEQNRMFLK